MRLLSGQGRENIFIEARDGGRGTRPPASLLLTQQKEFVFMLKVHVGPEAVLVTVHLAAHGAQGLGGGALVVVVAGDVNTQTVLILHLPPALLAPQPLTPCSWPETRSCNNKELSERPERRGEQGTGTIRNNLHFVTASLLCKIVKLFEENYTIARLNLISYFIAFSWSITTAAIKLD